MRVLHKPPTSEEIEGLQRGSLVERAVRGGQASCRCASGELHPAAYLSVAHRGRRNERVPVPHHLMAAMCHGIAVHLK